MATTTRKSPHSTRSMNRPAHTLRHRRPQPRAIAFAVGAALLPWTFLDPALAQTTASTLPAGGQVAAGSATLTYSPNKLQIDQATGKAIINWDSFSIGSSAWVNFSQPSSSAVALNRVVGSSPSEIYGRLTANGSVYFTNPNGVLFARGASVEVGSLFATTLSIADQDFLAGRYNFYNAGGAGSAVNEGSITVNGYAALAGPQVRNDGIIIARAGTVALAAGDRVSLDMVGDGLIKVSVDQAAMNASAINAGTIEADGGNVILTARSANALLDTVVNNSGIIRANSLVERNGEIVLDGGSAGVVSNTGTLSAAGTEAGTTGGIVKVLGDSVALLSGSNIDVSGDAGGGTALIGGNLHGAGPEQNASATTIDANTSINADAITKGNGGNIAVWSDGQTRVGGTFTARGGAIAGDGGFIETSGQHLTIDRGTTVNTLAPHGTAGIWLLDPDEFIIAALGGDIDGATLGSNLDGGDVTIASTSGTQGGTSGDILVQDAVSWTAATQLYLTATRNIDVTGGSISATSGRVKLEADNIQSGTGNVLGIANVTVGGGTTVVLGVTGITAADNRVYDATTTASFTGTATFTGTSTDDPTPTATAEFNDKNVGTAKTVTIGATGAHTYLVATQPALSADITPASLSLNAVIDSKVYDATTSSAGVVTFTGLQGGDTVTGATQSFQSKNVLGTNGSALQVNGGYAVNDGNSGNNYTVTTSTATGTITPASLTINAVTDTKVYDATINSSVAPSVAGLLGTDTVSGATQVFTSKNVLGGNNSTLQVSAYTVNDGNAGNNYTVTSATASGTITSAALALNAVTDTKVYDATTSSAGVVTFTGLQGSDTVTGATQSFQSKNVLGTNGSTLQVNGGYTVDDGNSGNNYTVTTNIVTGTITPYAVTLTAPSVAKVYDGNLSYATAGADLTSITSSGPLLGADAVTAANITYTNKDVGTGKTVTLNSVAISDGNGGANYTVTRVGNSTSNITRLGSVLWVGPASGGDWSNPANWAGGAIPDLTNVSSVNLNGATVNFSLSGVQVDSISNGSLNMTGGSFGGSGLNATLGSFTQTGGSITTSGPITIAATNITPGTITSSGGQITLIASSSIFSGGTVSGTSAQFSSTTDVSGVTTSVGGTMLLAGSANTWTITGSPQPSLFQTTNPNANVYFNGACVGGPACGTVIVIVGTIGSTVAQIAAQALKDAQSTDSVAKIIDYGFAGDVGTTPPMDHRIDVDGISTPTCFEESRESAACKNN